MNLKGKQGGPEGGTTQEWAQWVHEPAQDRRKARPPQPTHNPLSHKIQDLERSDSLRAPPLSCLCRKD